MTEISADEQVTYRLGRQARCGVVDGAGTHLEAADDRAVGYRLEGADGVLVWVGSGLDGVGLTAGTPLTEEGEAAARRLMSGCHPETGARLVTGRTSVRADSRATLTVAPLLRAIEEAAAARGVDPEDLLEGKPKQLAKLKQQQRVVAKKGEAQRLHVETVHKLARAAGVDLADVYGESELASAWEHKDLRIDSRVRGWDLVLDLPKSDSLLAGLMSETDEREYRVLVHQARTETLRALEGWIGYAVGSEDGEPVRLATGGLLGWSVEHRAARPMGDGQPGDTHLHQHVVIANMAHCEDGKWRSIANSGKDLYRHASAADAFFKARVRALTAQRFGVRRTQAETTRAWEVDGIPEELRDAYSRRAAHVVQQVGEDATLQEKQRVDAETRRAKHAADAAGMRESCGNEPKTPASTSTSWWPRPRPARTVRKAVPVSTDRPGRASRRRRTSPRWSSIRRPASPPRGRRSRAPSCWPPSPTPSRTASAPRRATWSGSSTTSSGSTDTRSRCRTPGQRSCRRPPATPPATSWPPRTSPSPRPASGSAAGGP
ncbi:relaxase domain-containing protein (plasmid) [Streptomyces cellulosae]|nr:relaxase domain-containing protein [Streptomyces cellulosae]WTB73715.1 relaxase domain-containing protein [Streptomyces cellulosae]